MYKWLAVGHKTRTLPQPRPPPPALALLGPVAHAKYGWHAAVGPARHGPARSGSDRSGIVWCPLCGTYACNYFYKFIHIVPFMALPVAGLRGRQRAARSSSIDLLLTLPSSYFLLSPPSPFLLSHFVAHTSLSLPVPEPESAMTLHRQNCMLIASSQLQTKPNRTAQLRQFHHTRPGHAPPHSNIHWNRKSMRSHYASDDSESQPGQSQSQRQSRRITDQLKFRPGRQLQTSTSKLAK